MKYVCDVCSGCLLTVTSFTIPPSRGIDHFKSFLKYSSDSYSIQNDELTKDYTDSIGEQIAFLLLTINTSSNILDKTKVINLCNNLAILKNNRNSLYLTHGDESDTTFFQQLEKDNGAVALQDCAQLFEIVYFLLKGCYINVVI